VTALPTLVVTSGEPAGIGPELCVAVAAQQFPARVAFLGDPQLFRDRAQQLGIDITVTPLGTDDPIPPQQAGQLRVFPVPLAEPSRPGILNAANGAYVVELLDRAVEQCRRNTVQAMVTAPVQKSTIADAGIAFMGHTEYLAAKLGVDLPVMLLAGERLRVALVTTHLALTDVAAAITSARLTRTLEILHSELSHRFGLTDPHISVLGLNPHAGEAGHLGREEIEVIEPVLSRLRRRGMRLTGPTPADTAFISAVDGDVDAVLAMYHDQGLPVIKTVEFGEVVNVTLGLPIIRTSVDHGTALDIAGSGKASPASLLAAMQLAANLATGT
jgi:4-hydroxythreonine-4-phosphate dehydrogenase